MTDGSWKVPVRYHDGLTGNVHESFFAAEKEKKMPVSLSSGAMILCIDDDRDILNLLGKILSGAGYTIIKAEWKTGTYRSPEQKTGFDSFGYHDAGD